MRIPALTYGKLYDTRNLQNTDHTPAIKFLNQLSTDSVSFGSSERQLTNQEVIQNFKKYFRTKACEEKDGTIRIKSYASKGIYTDCTFKHFLESHNNVQEICEDRFKEELNRMLEKLK